MLIHTKLVVLASVIKFTLPLCARGHGSIGQNRSESPTNKMGMGSLFIVNCPTREYEMNLRQKEYEAHLAKERDTGSAFQSEDTSELHLETHFSNLSLPNLPSLGLVTDDENTLNRLKQTKISEVDIQNIIDTIYLEKHLEECMRKFNIWHAQWAITVSETSYQVTFTAPQSISEKIIHHLQTCGFGTKYESSVCVSAASVYLADETHHFINKDKYDKDKFSDDEDDDDQQRKTGRWNDFVASIKSRLTVAQVVQTVQNNAAITFDYIVMIIVAASIAALGLLENNSVALVASMLISPLMSPIMAFVFSCVIHDKNLMKIGASGGLLGLFQCLMVGFLTGIMIESKPFDGPWAKVEDWPTMEMIARSQIRSLMVGALIAIPSGVGVALSILAGNSGSLVGVAISASLLPPAVNCGVFWGMALVVAIKEHNNHGSIMVDCNQYLGNGSKSEYFQGHYRPSFCKNAVKEWATMGTFSLLLTILNIILIFVFGIIILRIKEFAPYTTRKNLHRFWKEDLKAVRKYNTTHGGEMREEDILNDINKADNPDELKKNLENDLVLNTINKKTGATMHDFSIYANQRRAAKETKKVEPPPPPTPQPGGWYWSNWFKKANNPVEEEAPVQVVEETKARKVIIRRPSL